MLVYPSHNYKWIVNYRRYHAFVYISKGFGMLIELSILRKLYIGPRMVLGFF